MRRGGGCAILSRFRRRLRAIHSGRHRDPGLPGIGFGIWGGGGDGAVTSIANYGRFQRDGKMRKPTTFVLLNSIIFKHFLKAAPILSPIKSRLLIFSFVIFTSPNECCWLFAQDERKPPSEEKLVRLDANGDPLPAGALARLGTVRLRHSSTVSAVAFSPDGKHLASVGWDWGGEQEKPINLWEVSTGKRIFGMKLDDNVWVHCVTFSPDGKVLVTGPPSLGRCNR